MTQFDRNRSRSAASIIMLLVAALLVWALPAGAARATAPHWQRCVSVRATGTGQDLGGGETTATILLREREVGTTHAMFVVTGVTDDVATFTGEIEFTPSELAGTLAAPLSGDLDLTSGRFTATSDDVTGTGVLARVTGSVSIRGEQNLSTGAFTERLAARLVFNPLTVGGADQGSDYGLILTLTQRVASSSRSTSTSRSADLLARYPDRRGPGGQSRSGVHGTSCVV